MVKLSTRAVSPEAQATPDGHSRTVIEAVSPQIEGGRYPIKRVPGESVVVEADVFGDGHDAIACAVLFRHSESDVWQRAAMEPIGNDRWRDAFPVSKTGTYRYTVEAWVDHFASWRSDLVKRADAGQDLSVAFTVGARFLEAAAERAPVGWVIGEASTTTRLLRRPRSGPATSAPRNDRRKGAGIDEGQARAPALDATGDTLQAWAKRLVNPKVSQKARLALALSEEVAEAMAAHPDLRFASRYPQELRVEVDRPRAGFSTWYEMFPRSAARKQNTHGTFRDVEARLPYVAGMGFDVLYLPPIHPIGESHRKGKNNAVIAKPGEPGSPWAIGSKLGGHKAVNPGLGTLDEFQHLVGTARDKGIEIALDIAFQCSPDHPYVREHPEWFKHRPDGSIQYAENPPKKYEDIYPFDFETPHWRSLWEELKSVVEFWAEQGVTIFRIDNPHTKPFAFWEWLVREVRGAHPGVLFLAEAFTRPKVMYRLAKLGFTQSYTYFAWRNSKREIIEYVRELTSDPAQQFFRPNFWPNTPDILTEQMQHGGRAAFMARLFLAATLSGNYGIYGPAYELGEHVAREPGSEEYLNSEKYEVRHWDLEQPGSLRGFITAVNRARRENQALQSTSGIVFHGVDNDQVLCYSKTAESNVMLMVVNLDPSYTQSGWVDLSMPDLGLGWDETFQVHDRLSGARYRWRGPRNFIQLDPNVLPAHLFRVERA